MYRTVFLGLAMTIAAAQPAGRIAQVDDGHAAGIWVSSKTGPFVSLCTADCNLDTPSIMLMDPKQKCASLAFALGKDDRPYMQVLDPDTKEVMVIDLVDVARSLKHCRPQGSGQ